MLQVLLRESPRSIFLIDSEGGSSGGIGGSSSTSPQQYGKTALLLTTASQASEGSTSSSLRAVVEVIQLSDVPALDTLQVLHRRSYGCLGLINVGSGKLKE
jgi:hypothetical protein